MISPKELKQQILTNQKYNEQLPDESELMSMGRTYFYDLFCKYLDKGLTKYLLQEDTNNTTNILDIKINYLINILVNFIVNKENYNLTNDIVDYWKENCNTKRFDTLQLERMANKLKTTLNHWDNNSLSNMEQNKFIQILILTLKENNYRTDISEFYVDSNKIAWLSAEI